VQCQIYGYLPSRECNRAVAGTKLLFGDRGTLGVSSLPKAITRWCLARNWTRDLWFACPMSYQ